MMPKPAAIVRGVAVVAVLGVITGLAIAAPGFDSKETVPDSGSVWAYASGTTQRYGEVNTALGELNSVKEVEHPSTIVQTASTVLMFSHQDAQLIGVNSAAPVDLVGKSAKPKATGAQQVVSSGNYVAYRTGSGVSGGTLADAKSGHLRGLAMGTGGKHVSYSSTAIAVDDSGVVYSYSAKSKSVERFSLGDNRLLGTDTVTSPPKSGVTITAIDGTWAMLSGSKLWFAGKSPVRLSLAGAAQLEQPATGVTGTVASEVFIADNAGLKAYKLGGSASPVIEQSENGTPAAPTVLNGVVYAAWLSSSGPGGLWSSRNGKTTPLDYGGKRLSSSTAITPAFQTNGRNMILNETTRGWVWTVPDGKLVQSSQAWEAKGSTTPQQSQTTTQVQKVVDPKPPVADADSFGVRAGQLVTLPVLLNDHDPNEDVLNIVPSSLTGLSPQFGTLRVTDNDQEIVATVAPGATGAATFSYQVTDGTTVDGGLKSPLTTVTLTVKGGSVESAPKWCGAGGCLTKWPTPQVAPGSKVTANVLDGWVDPEGDPFFISSVTIANGAAGSVASTPQGEVIYQDPNPGDSGKTVHISVNVSDTAGLTTEKTMKVTVTRTPALTAKSFVVVGEAGHLLPVDLASHVTGNVHGVSVVAAKSLTTGGKTSVDGTSSTFTFQAANPGSYLVDFTVADGTRQQTGLARVIVVSANGFQLTTSPVTAFVQEDQDATIDVLSAVSNPENLVLLVSGVTSSPLGGGQLEVNPVAQSQLRISGTSASGQPGKLGVVNYTVSDGSGNRTATAQGQATVYLVATPAPARPIGVDDSVTVREGSEIDVPALDNDVSASGSTLDLDPTSIQVPAKSGMAFASGHVVRYLAPSKPGKYDVQYRVYTAGYPLLSDTATIHFSVIGSASNAAPQPSTLTARVSSGESVSIPFSSYGVDPDGDPVSLATITQQPHQGSASISPDGTALIYTSFVGSLGGGDEFSYKVRDPQGKTGTASIIVGVLAAEDADPSPVTYSDYVTIKAGGQAVVYPTANDIDPTGGTLKLGAKSVVPDLPQTGTTLAAYQDQLKTMNPRVSGNTIKFSTGQTPGTRSFLYTVTDSSTGATAEGRIVITIVTESVPQWPVVTDTTATAVTRSKLPQGINVVSGKVSWAAGDASKLTLSLVGNPSGFSVIGGTDIRGSASDNQTATITFELAGKDFAGNAVHTYGFLHIPSLATTTLSLVPGLKALQVEEGAILNFDIAKYVPVPKGSTLAVDKTSSSLQVSGSRESATCKLVGGTSVRYDPSKGTLYDDSCTVPVKIASQTYYSYLTVSIHIRSKNPQPALGVTSLVASPGKAGIQPRYNLEGITTWDGDASKLTFKVTYSGSQFTATIAPDGRTLVVKAVDTSVPGSQEIALVSVTGPGVKAPGPVGHILLRVGPAPSQLPVGAHVTHTCAQTDPGNACTVQVTSQPGEINPFSTDLTLVSVMNPASCPQLTYSVASAHTVNVSWSNTAPGASCAASFVVSDSEQRQGTGLLTIDFEARASAPDSVQQVAYTATSVTLSVTPGAAAAAYPSLGGFHIYSSGSGAPVATCQPGGECSSITGLQPGVKTTFTAKSFNTLKGSTVDSLQGVSTSAWAYRTPSAPTITSAQSAYSSANTATLGTLTITVTPDPSGPELSSYQADCDGTTDTFTANGSASATSTHQFPVSCTSLEVRAVAKVPPFNGSDGNGDQSAPHSVTVAGTPIIGGISASSPSNGSIAISVSSQDANNGNALTFYYATYTGNAGTCTTGDGSAADFSTGGREETPSSSSTISGLDGTIAHTVVACATNGYGIAELSETKVAAQPIDTYPGGTYTISDGSSSGTYSFVGPAESAAPSSGLVTVLTPGSVPFGTLPNVTARYCLHNDTSVCGNLGPVAAANSAAQEPVHVTSPRLSCDWNGGSSGGVYVANGSASFDSLGSLQVTNLQYKEPGFLSNWQDQSDPNSIPPTATQIRGNIEVTWGNGIDAGLAPYSSGLKTVNCSN
jgi:hypothetical protein